MKIAVFGATGKTGQHLVKQALEEGHQVTAFARSPEKLGINHPQLAVVQGDVNDAASVKRAVEGQDVVISALGPTNNQDDVMGAAADNIVKAMQASGVRRLITLTGAGVEDPNDEPKLVNRFISFLLKTTAPKVYEQSYKHVQKVRASNLDWTVVRVPMLNDEPAKGSIKIGYVGKGTGTKITRADVADFMLKQAKEDQYLHKAPMISN